MVSTSPLRLLRVIDLELSRLACSASDVVDTSLLLAGNVSSRSTSDGEDLQQQLLQLRKDVLHYCWQQDT